MRLIEELRQKYPGMAERSKRSSFAAIRLFCLECMGGSVKEVRDCAAAECSLHPFRDGHRPAGAAEEGPVVEEEEELAVEEEEGPKE